MLHYAGKMNIIGSLPTITVPGSHYYLENYNYYAVENDEPLSYKYLD